MSATAAARACSRFFSVARVRPLALPLAMAGFRTVADMERVQSAKMFLGFGLCVD
jgi:hypothetical protein